MPFLGTTAIKKCVLYGQLLVLLSAFLSIYPQIHGLFGERGLAPVAPMLECEEESIFQCRLPVLRFICNLFNFSPSVGLQVFCFIGICLSAYAICNPRWQNIITFLILYLMYRNIYEAGGVFMYYQWDAFLLESTFYVALLAWFGNNPADSIALYNIVMLLVRVLFMNGSTKLLSKCPSWWNLTALDYHFESQPIPTPLSFYAHYLPPSLKQFATLAIFYAEIFLPPFFLIPLVHVRYFLFFAQVLLMVLSLLTTNSSFFNYNILALLISLLDTPKWPQEASIISAVVFAKLAYDTSKLPVKIAFGTGSLPVFALNVSYEEVQDFIIYYIDMMLIFMVATFIIVTVYAGLKVWTGNGRIREKWSKMFQLAYLATTVFLLNSYGTIPLLRLDEELAQKTSAESPVVMSYFKTAQSWGLANAYGSYRHMTGIHGRPEIVIEGAHTIEGPWKEIGFEAKPGFLGKRPRFVSPHHPRLDVQMYYAAEGTYQQNPFFLSLVYHLMQNTTEVVSLVEDYPFKNHSEPMKFVRAKLYMYHFTKRGEKNWWRRDFQEEYMPAFNKGNDALRNFLIDHRIINKKKSKFVNGPLGSYLKTLHRLTDGNDLIFAFTVVFTLSIVKKLYLMRQDRAHPH